jgi:two-component system response regulator RegA
MLVVEDDAVFRERLVRALADRRWEAYGAEDEEQALAEAARLKPPRAVVDLRLPHGSGLEVVRRLKAWDPSMEVAVLTGYGSIATAKEAMRLGARDYLTKPADADQILAAFEQQGEATGEPPEPPEQAPTLERVEWEHIQRVLNDCGGNVSEAARVLGLHRRSLQRKLSRQPPDG